MRLVRFRHLGETRVGLIDGDCIRQVATPTGAAADDLLSLIHAWVERGPSAVQPDGPETTLDQVRLLAPVPNPARNIVCVGKNYHDHADEFAASGYDASDDGRAPAPEFPIVFTKPGGSVIGPEEPIDPHCDLTSALDYEVEIAVIIGRGGRGIARTEAMQHVWGYTLVNDITARDLQQRHQQWFIGKSLDTFCPMGPWAVTADEVEGADLDLLTTVNGEVRQRANTRDLIFDIPTLVASLSAGMTLQTGDIIATGTPAGVGIGFDPPRFLRPGDVVSVSATGLGTLTNPVASP